MYGLVQIMPLGHPWLTTHIGSEAARFTFSSMAMHSSVSHLLLFVESGLAISGCGCFCGSDLLSRAGW